MNFPTPAESVSAETETQTETEESPIFGERNDDFEAYDAVINTEGVLQLLCLTNGVGVDGDFARYTEAEGESPLADHGLFYYRQKNEMKADFRERRESGDLPEDANLPNYREEFPEPDFDHVVVSKENAAEFGIDPEVVPEDREYTLPTDYEPETDDDGNLIVWYESTSNHSVNDYLAALESVDGIGKKTSGRALNALQAAGLVPSDL